MYAVIQKWGNSQGLRIPKALLDSAGLCENDRVELVADGDVISIRRAAPVHRSLARRLSDFYGKDVSELEKLDAGGEVDWGSAKGGEAW